MARNKVLEKAKVTMPSGRDPFDLSCVSSQTALAGELNVCYVQPMVAGTKGSISRKCFSRSADVVSPAFHQVTEHFDFFIVPIHSLWRTWENWKLNINDLQDTNLVPWDSTNNLPDISLPLYAPRVDFTDLIDELGYTPATSPTAAHARYANDLMKLCESFGYGDAPARTVATFGSKIMSVLFAGAYQKCYFEHYRNTAYESNNPYAYNFDWLYDGVRNGLFDSTAVSGNEKDKYCLRELFKIRRVNYRNDYFHNIYPALNYVISAPVGAWSLPSNVAGASVKEINSQNNPILNFQTTSSSISPSVLIGAFSNANRGVSVQQIRALFALDKLMRASAYAPKHVREQYKAQFGVDGVEDFDMQSERIGSFQSDVVFQEVTNMAQSSSANLGDLGAKGVGGSGRDEESIKFYCKYDSIVIGLHYFLPRARYDAFGFHPWNISIAREDFYIKAFENLGLRPFYTNFLDSRYTNNQIGWTVPNFQYKIKPDLNYGPFKSSFTEFSFDSTAGTITKNMSQTSQLSTFVPHVTANAYTIQTGNISAEYFKVAPEDLDNIFVNKVPADHKVSFYQFYGEYRISVPVVAPMSTHGQPSL